jgi:hypothetical protein
MENRDAIDDYIKKQLALRDEAMIVPDVSLVSSAIKKVAARKKRVDESDDLLTWLAAFLNMKIKLYHAVLASVILAIIIFFATKQDTAVNTESHTNHYVSNIASVRSSTVLSSIRTFGGIDM